MKILVTGGAGYIGAHICKLLAGSGHEVAVFDNLSSGHAAAVRWGPLHCGDLRDRSALDSCLRVARPEAVVHFGGVSNVTEALANPEACNATNVGGTLNLLECMRSAGLRQLVFASSAAVYGEPDTERISEDHPQRPINPYGQSKQAAERLLAQFAEREGLRCIALRCFNVAGADPERQVGEAHQPETHLIPLLLNYVAGGAPPPAILGDDFGTPDGTCIRDYVHVQDVGLAALAALRYQPREPGFHGFNVGHGRGHSVREVIAAVTRVTRTALDLPVATRRQGDPSRLVASNEKARALLNWKAEHSELARIVADAWHWHRQPTY